MKRSDINTLIGAAERCLVSHSWALPPNARWDVRLGAWRHFGLVMINLAEEQEDCTGLVYAPGGTKTPTHCHRSKQEDIICRGGRLAVGSWSGRPDERHRQSMIIPVNHERPEILSGAVIELDAASRITLLPECHPLSQESIFGEVSNANYFVNPNIGRYPRIEGDEVAIVRLVSEE